MALQWGTRLTFHMLTWPHQWLLLLFMHQDGIIKRVPRPFIHPISTPVAPLAKPTTTKVAIQSPVRVVHVQSQAKCNNNRVTTSKIGHIRAKSSFISTSHFYPSAQHSYTHSIGHISRPRFSSIYKFCHALHMFHALKQPHVSCNFLSLGSVELSQFQSSVSSTSFQCTTLYIFTYPSNQTVMVISLTPESTFTTKPPCSVHSPSD